MARVKVEPCDGVTDEDGGAGAHYDEEDDE